MCLVSRQLINGLKRTSEGMTRCSGLRTYTTAQPTPASGGGRSSSTSHHNRVVTFTFLLSRGCQTFNNMNFINATPIVCCSLRYFPIQYTYRQYNQERDGARLRRGRSRPPPAASSRRALSSPRSLSAQPTRITARGGPSGSASRGTSRAAPCSASSSRCESRCLVHPNAAAAASTRRRLHSTDAATCRSS